MSLLELQRVGKRYAYGARERLVLSEASLELEAGELAVVWGLRGSGRSTLLRIAAGIEAPDSGTVRFAGRDLAGAGEELLGEEIGYCQKTLRSAAGQAVLDQVVVGLLVRGVFPGAAHSRARAALERAGAESCAELRPCELDGAETVRVAIARALALRPRLLVIDEPTRGVDGERDSILRLLRSLADEGIAVLASSAESSALSGADRALALSEGELRGGAAPELAPVLPLRRAAGGRAGA